MKKLSIPALSCAVLFVMLGSCSKYEELNPVEPQNEETQSWASAHRSLEKAVYDEQTGSWVLPQADPYALGNFQKAYDNLSSGKSISNRGDKKALKEFSIPRTLQATHYTLKVFPRDEIELGKLEVMEGVKISYWPFDYVLLSKEESEKLDSSKGEKGASAVLKDQRRYTVTYTDLQTTDGPVPDESFVMPVLYAVWPCDKPLPVELDHEITGEVFLPAALFDENSKSWSTSGNSKEGEAMSIEALELIHNEAIALALPEMAITRADPMPPIRMVFLKAVQADTHTADLEPMANLRIVIQLGSRVWDNKYTDSEGRLALMVGTNLLASSIPYEATMRHQFHYPGRWKITVGGSPNSESALTIIQDETMAYRWPAGSPAEFLYTYSDSEHYATIHRAVNYFYFGDHLVPKEVYDDGIKIVAMGESNSEANGMFYYVRPFQKAYIRMYNNNTLNHPMKISAPLSSP